MRDYTHAARLNGIDQFHFELAKSDDFTDDIWFVSWFICFAIDSN